MVSHVKICMVILIDAGTKSSKYTFVRSVLSIVMAFFKAWIMSGKIKWRAVIYSANIPLNKHTASVEEINGLMFCDC